MDPTLSEGDQMRLFRKLRRQFHRVDKAERKFIETVFAGLAQELAAEGDSVASSREKGASCCSCCSGEPEAREGRA